MSEVVVAPPVPSSGASFSRWLAGTWLMYSLAPETASGSIAASCTPR